MLLAFSPDIEDVYANIYDMLENMRLSLGDQEIARILLGGARWSIEDPPDDANAEALIERAVASGIDMIDTARAYTRRGAEGHNEALIARVLDRIGARERVLVSTKGGHFRDGDHYIVDASPSALRADCHRSLAVLRTDRIDLYFLHFPDPAVPFAESVGALEELRGEGRIARIGLCNVDSEQLDIALGIAPIAAVQHRHAIGAPAPAELLARCHSHDIAFLGYSPLGGGGAREVLDAASVPGSPAARIAAEHGVAVASVLLAKLLAAGPHVGLITGARRQASLDASLAAARLVLSRGELESLDEQLSSLPRDTAG